MLDLKFIRENPGIVRKDLEKRQDAEKLGWIDDLLKKDEEYRKLLQENEALRCRRNGLSQEINLAKKEGKDVKQIVQEAKDIPAKIKETQDKMGSLLEKIKFYQMRIPNILHESVPAGKDSSENVVVKKSGKVVKPKFELKSHGELAEDLGIADFKRAAKVAGTGFYYLKGDLALLDHALQRFAIDFLIKKGFTLVETPMMMNRKAYEGVTDLADFEKVMYKIQDEDFYMIATSEHPMVSMYMGETIDKKDLPIMMCGISSCFRKEIGSHGVDTRGLFRVHQFNKVEQVIICEPKDSWKIHEQVQKNSEQIFKLLGLPYRVVNICTGDIGIVAAKKYDIEAWFPRQDKYAEVTSASNCTAYQAVRLGIKYRDGEKVEYVHTLNNTGIATSRAIVAILENCQQKDGSVKIPKALWKYMGGKKVINGKKGGNKVKKGSSKVK